MVDEEPQYDVKVENAFKSYGKNSIINGLNMNVRSGSIYGLLGPSGCGKTTLLRCILGTLTLDSGCIDLKAQCLKDIGYMPQDTSLEETLTIREIFEFYGKLYNMSNSEIENRLVTLNKFLKLPNLNGFIKDISGGQNRRVSLAISILHDPKIIILDEPTVGIDPVLRQEIWAEFVKMVRERKRTIIITTHYIEEANLADRIGLMRNGIFVEEGSPQQILTKYNTDSLENCFLKACCNQDTNKVSNNINPIRANEKSKKLSTFKNNFSYYRFKALLKKHYFACIRDYILLFITVFLPIFQTPIYCIVFGKNIKDIPIAVKNDEINFLDCQYSNFNGCIFDENTNETVSCVVLKYLQSLDYKIVEVEDREFDDLSMYKEKYTAFLYFPKNFTQHFIAYIDRDENYMSLAYAHLSKNNFVLTNQITKQFTDAIKYSIKKTLTDCSNNPTAMSIPMKSNIVYGHDVKSVTNTAINLFLALLPFHTSSVYSLSIMMSEKMDGTLNRSMISGVKVLELVMSLLCIATMLNVIQMLSLCFIAFVLFSNPILITNGLFVYALLLMLSGWIGFLCGLISAVITPTKVGGVYLVTGISLTQFLITGIIWPVEGQTQFLRKMTVLTPLRLIGNTMNNIALKGWTWNHPSIIIGTSGAFTVLGLLTLALIILGKLKKDLWVLSK